MGNPVPKYWWDFTADSTAIIVQSDATGEEALAKFEQVRLPFSKQFTLTPAIKEAEELIADFVAGRKTPKSISQTY